MPDFTYEELRIASNYLANRLQEINRTAARGRDQLLEGDKRDFLKDELTRLGALLEGSNEERTHRAVQEHEAKL